MEGRRALRLAPQALRRPRAQVYESLSPAPAAGSAFKCSLSLPGKAQGACCCGAAENGHQVEGRSPPIACSWVLAGDVLVASDRQCWWQKQASDHLPVTEVESFCETLGNSTVTSRGPQLLCVACGVP